MDSDSIQRVEAHNEAGEEFAKALRRSFPSIARHITNSTAISFHGTIKGHDVVCTFEQLPEDRTDTPAFSRHYDPTAPQVRERRKRLFEAIQNGHSAQSAQELRALANAYPGCDSTS